MAAEMLPADVPVLRCTYKVNDEGTQHMWMNEWEVAEAAHAFSATEQPNLYRAAQVLGNLVEWTNSNSDGWPYWRKPANAAKSLMDMLNEAMNAQRRGDDWDVRPTDVTKALSPIKAFLTRQGVDHAAVLPWAAIL